MIERWPEDDPRRLLKALGFDVPAGEGPSDAAAALSGLRAQIGADLEEKQGAWRRQAAWMRHGPAMLAALCGVAYVLALRPAHLTPLLAVACVAAGVAAALAFAAVVIAPSRPGRGEQLAGITLLVAAGALALEAVGAFKQGDIGFSLASTLRCSGMFIVGASAPLGLLWLGLSRSRLPVRRRHHAALASAALAVGGLGVWRHCAPNDLWHMLSAHVALPAVLLPFLVLLLALRAKR